jgi:5-(carboxyamino)imidazole ribonucleotide synthase
MTSALECIGPGGTIGILGDGQLGKMLAMAAAKLGYKVKVLGPGGRESPAGQVSYGAYQWAKDGLVHEPVLNEFLNGTDVVTIEWENVPVALVKAIETRGIPVRPSSKVLEISQDRIAEKDFADQLGIPTPTYREIGATKSGSLRGKPCATKSSILKTRKGGYDGRGQIHLSKGEWIDAAWKQLGCVPCILEEKVDFIAEISVIVVRAVPSDQSLNQGTAVYGPFENHHKDGILQWTRYPMEDARLIKNAGTIKKAAGSTAVQLANKLDVHGALAVEFFVTEDGGVIFNEMAPRPHNSAHLTIECAYTSQFEQIIRAICNLPWGRTDFHSGGLMRNILGDEAEEWPRFLTQDDVVHFYGKGDAKPGRKMGHSVKRYSLKRQFV